MRDLSAISEASQPASQAGGPRFAYAIAAVGIAAAVLLRWILDPWLGDQIVFTTLYGAIAAASWYGGYRPALAAVALGLVACEYLFIDPRGSFAIRESRDYIPILLYLLTSSIIVGIGEAMRIARHRQQEGRELLRVTFASIGDAVMVTDGQGRITYLNAVGESLTGWTPQEAVGQPLDVVFRIINEQTRQPADSPVRRALRDGRIVGLANHTILIAKDGKERAIDDSAAPIRDESGDIRGCVLIFREITTRREAEEALRRSEEKIRSVVDTVVDGIITIDERGTIETFNPAAETLFGFTASEVIGRNVKMLMPEPYHHEHDEYLARYLRTGEARIIGIGREVVGRRNDGSTFPMELAVSEFDIEGRHCFTGIVRDISERKVAEHALEEADRRKNEFLAMLSHELRNPLAPIRNAIQILKIKGPPHPDLQWGREVIDRQVQHMVRLLDDLLDVSRISHGKLQLQKEWVLLTAAMEHAVEASRPLIEAERHELSISVPEESLHVHADFARLSQVMTNLLNNAAKYTEKGGHIELAARREGSEVLISVKDNGIGIAASQLPNIFEMFSQSTTSIGRSQGGLGVGLSLVHGLVEMHGGRVEVTSDLGKGSEFIVRLPLSSERPVPTAVTASAEVTAVQACRVLVVDDVTDSAESLGMLMQMMGNEVRIAYDANEAIRAAESFLPELILLDIGMAGMNGYEAAGHIRKQSWGKEMHIIALTGWGQEEDRHRSKLAGFNDHLVKPIDPETLKGVIARFLADRQAASSATKPTTVKSAKPSR